MKGFLFTVWMIGVFQMAHIAILHFGIGGRHIRLVDFIVHKLTTSLAIAMFLGDLCWSNFGMTIALAGYWGCYAGRHYIAAVAKAVWQSFGRQAAAEILGKASASLDLQMKPASKDEGPDKTSDQHDDLEDLASFESGIVDL